MERLIRKHHNMLLWPKKLPCPSWIASLFLLPRDNALDRLFGLVVESFSNQRTHETPVYLIYTGWNQQLNSLNCPPRSFGGFFANDLPEKSMTNPSTLALRWRRLHPITNRRPC